MQIYNQQHVKIILTIIGLSFIIASFILGNISTGKKYSDHSFILPNEKILQTSTKHEISTIEKIDIAIEQVKSKNLETPPKISSIYQNQIHTIKKGDTLSGIFAKYNIPSVEVIKIIKNSKNNRKKLINLIPGKNIKILKNENNKLQNITLEISPTKFINIEKHNTLDKYNIDLQEKKINKKIVFNGNTIKNSLYNSAAEVGLNNKLISQMTDLFVWDIDFALDLRAGDNFRILYEEKYVEDKKIDSGDILVAEFINKGKIHHAVKYTDANGKTNYYSPEGRSLQKAFLRAPLKFSRISSPFNLSRKHPVLHIIRAHKGVDYAAAKGTPVKAAGDGKVDFIGVKGGYGNVIILQHGAKYTTVYGHLSKFAKHLKKGSKVYQSDVIGYVGSTGLATAPHLHYEFRINGVHHNPVTVCLPQHLSIASNEKDKFLQHATELLKTLDNHGKNRT